MGGYKIINLLYYSIISLYFCYLPKQHMGGYKNLNLLCIIISLYFCYLPKQHMGGWKNFKNICAGKRTFSLQERYRFPIFSPSASSGLKISENLFKSYARVKQFTLALPAPQIKRFALCREEDLNLHESPRLLLRQVRLPISPSRQWMHNTIYLNILKYYSEARARMPLLLVETHNFYSHLAP